MKSLIKLVKDVFLFLEWEALLWLEVLILAFVAGVIFLVYSVNHSGFTLPFIHTNGSSLQAPSSTPLPGLGGYITIGESIVTVYQLHDGCGQTEYWEYQVPSEDVKCSATGCQAKINGTWRVVVLNANKT